MLQVSSKERKNNDNLNIWLANIKEKKIGPPLKAVIALPSFMMMKDGTKLK